MGVEDMKYPEHIVEQVRAESDIVDVVSDYVALKQRGTVYVGLCPFHQEKTPSFSVNAEKQFYHCFGCGAGGNAIGFLMEIASYSFLDAVEELAKRNNIDLPEPEQTKEMSEQEAKKQRLIAIHNEAGKFYYHTLKKTPEGQKAYAYLRERGILDKTIAKFGLGYASGHRLALMNYLEKKGYQREDILKSGLVLIGKDGTSMYERFQRRIMFPIFDVRGNAIAFGGRILEQGDVKYLNSPETPIFNKSKNLYGLNLAKASKQKKLILVEGYMDLITMYQNGFFNVVACLGTAFNQQHAMVLKRYTGEIILLYDSDNAGINATLRAIPVLVEHGFFIQVAQVPNGKDPDGYIKEFGAKAFENILKEAVHYISFQIACVQRNYILEYPEEKVRFVLEVAGILANLQNEVERDVFLKEVSRLTNVEEQSIIDEMKKIKIGNEKKIQEKAKRTQQPRYQSAVQQVAVQQGQEADACEKELMRLCIEERKIYEAVEMVWKKQYFLIPFYQKFYEILGNFYVSGNRIAPAEVSNYFMEIEEQRKVIEIFHMELGERKRYELEEALTSIIQTLKIRYCDFQMNQIGLNLTAENVEQNSDQLLQLRLEKREISHLRVEIVTAEIERYEVEQE